MKNKKISKLSNHDKLINLIAVQDEKDVNYLLQSVDQVFIEVFKLKQKDLPWLSNNSEEEWDNVMRKVRLAIFKLYFEDNLFITLSVFSIITSSPKTFMKCLVLPVIIILYGDKEVNLTVSPILYLHNPALVVINIA